MVQNTKRVSERELENDLIDQVRGIANCEGLLSLRASRLVSLTK